LDAGVAAKSHFRARQNKTTEGKFPTVSLPFYEAAAIDPAARAFWPVAYKTNKKAGLFA